MHDCALTALHDDVLLIFVNLVVVMITGSSVVVVMETSWSLYVLGDVHQGLVQLPVLGVGGVIT